MKVLNDKRTVILILDTLTCKLQNSNKKAKMLCNFHMSHTNKFQSYKVSIDVICV